MRLQLSSTLHSTNLANMASDYSDMDRYMANMASNYSDMDSYEHQFSHLQTTMIIF